MKKSFRKLRRLELVEMIYQLRKDNLEQRKRCQELERQLSQAEEMLRAYTENTNVESLGRIENLLEKVYEMKKFSAILLALVLVLAMSAPAFAQVVGTATDGTGSITISNAAKGETYSVYKLFDASVTGKEDGSIAYTGTIPDGLGDYFTKDDAGNITCKVNEMTEELQNALKTWADEQKPESATASAESDGSGLTFAGLPYGYYVITTSQGAAISVDSTNPNVTVYDKNSTDPITPPDKNKDYKKVDEDDVSIGDTVTYTIEFFTANYDEKDQVTSYIIKDTLPEFLSDVTVTSITVDNTAIDVKQFDDNGEITIEWIKDGSSLYKNGAKLVITYTAVVSDKVAIAGAGNTNTVTIDYTTTSSEGGHEVEDTATIYSYAIAIKKVNAAGKALAGATFELPFYVNSTADTDGAYVYAGADAGDGLTNTLTTPENGVIVIKGVESAEYSIIETAAPAGYNKLASPVKVTATQTSEIKTSVTKYIDADGNVTDTETETEVTYKNDNLAATTVIVVNKTGSELPSTGGIGTTIFYVVGGLMMAAAVVLLVSKKMVAAGK